MQISLVLAWDGSPAPAGVGGLMRLEEVRDHLALSWEIELPSPPWTPEAEPGYLDGLWGFDVVELFLASPDRVDARPRYVEVEVGPAGHWLALSFDGVRRRRAEWKDLDPVVSSSVEGTLWRGEARLPLERIVEAIGLPPWKGLVTMAVGGASGSPRLFLTSAPLPGAEPDFHQPGAWPDILI